MPECRRGRMGAPARLSSAKELPPETKDRVILTAYDPVTIDLIEKLKNHQPRLSSDCGRLPARIGAL
jgi:hypothetical protein